MLTARENFHRKLPPTLANRNLYVKYWIIAAGTNAQAVAMRASKDLEVLLPHPYLKWVMDKLNVRWQPNVGGVMSSVAIRTSDALLDEKKTAAEKTLAIKQYVSAWTVNDRLQSHVRNETYKGHFLNNEERVFYPIVSFLVDRMPNNRPSHPVFDDDDDDGSGGGGSGSGSDSNSSS
jgi:hypothetical protein